MKMPLALRLPFLLIGFATFLGSSFAADHRVPDLPALLTMNDGTAVTSPEQWKARRAQLLQQMCDTFIGSFPKETPRIVEARVLSQSVAKDGSTRRNVRLTFDTPHRASFDIWIWLPKGAKPRPLLLVAPRFYQLDWAKAAIRRGYAVCLYPGVDSSHAEADYPNYQNVWKSFHAEYPEATWTEITTKAWIAGRALDYLLDPTSGCRIAAGQVAIIGHSRYGKQALIAGAIDPRITAIVARSSGTPAAAPCRFVSRSTFSEAPSDWPGGWFLASLNPMTGREDRLPVDAHGWAALVAPRNLLLDTAYYDDGDPTFAVERGFVASSAVYRLLGVENRFRLDYRDGWHDPITPKRCNRNIDWFDACFHRGTATRDDFPQHFIHQFDWNAWQSKLATSEKTNPYADSEPVDNADRLARIRWALGQPPAATSSTRPRTFFTSHQSEMIGHDRWQAPDTARVPVRFGDNVLGNLYFNKNRRTAAPVVIWLHPYSYGSGYIEAYGVEGTTIYHRLAQKGYAVLAFDQLGFGQRLLEGRDFYEKHPQWSRLGRMVLDVHGAVDFVAEGKGASQGELPKLDKNQIHVLGYSLGGMVGLYGAALDGRIKSVASFAGFTPLRTDRSDKPTGGIRRLWQWTAIQPVLGLFDDNESQIPYDFDDVLAVIAPRPCLIYSPRQDRFADAADVAACVNRAGVFWKNAGAADRLTVVAPDDIGRFQAAQQEAYIAWLGKLVL